MNIELEKLRKILNDSPEIASAYLFGSAAKNEPVVNDLDILVLLYQKINQDNAYFELSYRIGQALNINADKVDVVFFDLDQVDPDVLYEAVNHGILLKNNLPELLTDKIEELSRYFLENEFLIREAKKLRRERIKEFCCDRRFPNRNLS
jgi:predicted nucleotidyltransferase